MKFFLSLLLLCIAASAGAQEADSINLSLQEVHVHAAARSESQKLYSYFKANEAATTEDIISRMPSLSLVRRGGFGQEPVIRSFSAGQTNLLLDGMRIQGACTDRMDPATIYTEPTNLQQIDVTTNGNSLMGASVGGHINLKLAAPHCGCEKPQLSGSFNSGYQSNANAFYEALRLNFSSQKFGLLATGSYRKSNDYHDGRNQQVNFSGFEKFNYSLAGLLDLGKNWSLNGHFIADDGWHIGYPALPMDVGYAYARIGSLSLMRHDAGKAWHHLEAKVYANRIVHYMDDTRRPDVVMHMDMPGASFTAGAYVEGTRRISQNKELSLRADVSETKLKASMTMYEEGQPLMFMLTWPDNRELRGGLAAQWQWHIDSLTTLLGTMRGDMHQFSLQTQQAMDQVSVFNDGEKPLNFFIPAVSFTLTRKLSQKFTANGSLSLGGRTPSASELYGIYLFNRFDGYDYLGQINLKPEQSVQGEVSLQYQQRTLGIKGTGYVSKVYHYITGVYDPSFSAMTIGANGVKRYTNLDAALLYGLEGSVLWQPSKSWNLVSTLKWNYGQDEAGAPLPLIPPFRNVTSLKKTLKNWWLQGEFEGAVAQNRVRQDAGEATTPGFAIWHLRAGYNISGKRLAWRLSGGVENLTNTYYHEHLDWGGIPRPGRNFYTMVGIGF